MWTFNGFYVVVVEFRPWTHSVCDILCIAVSAWFDLLIKLLSNNGWVITDRLRSFWHSHHKLSCSVCLNFIIWSRPMQTFIVGTGEQVETSPTCTHTHTLQPALTPSSELCPVDYRWSVSLVCVEHLICQSSVRGFFLWCRIFGHLYCKKKNLTLLHIHDMDWWMCDPSVTFCQMICRFSILNQVSFPYRLRCLTRSILITFC